MKKLLLTGVTLVGFACAVFAQGNFYLNTSSDNNGVAIDSSGNYYNAPGLTTPNAGVEVWELNGVNNSVISAINSVPVGPGSGVTQYAMLVPDGFKLEATVTGINIQDGVLAVAKSVAMPDVSPAGTTVTVALAIWNNATATSWANMVASAGAATRAGVLAFSQATAVLPAAPPNITTMNSQDLVMTTVPEPSTFALAGLGAAALLIFRRRK